MNERPAPWPYSCEASGRPGSNGDHNLYLIDKNKRKIAAIWGKRGEKEATAALLMSSGDLYAAAVKIRLLYTPGFPIDGDAMAELLKALELAEGTS